MPRLLSKITKICLFFMTAGLVGLFGLLAVWRFAPPISTLMVAKIVTQRPMKRVWAPLPSISSPLQAAVIASEDGQFCRHSGVDWQALSDVLENAGEDGPARGASTIPMQTAKNLFLWPSRSALRKSLEIPLAMTLDLVWPKKRILEVYLNIAEWGPGIFGVEAAAQKYFGQSAKNLTPAQAALLATALPNPILRNPARPSPGHQRLAQRLLARMGKKDAPLKCLE